MKTIDVGGIKLPIWRGPAYRAPSGYSAATTAADEVREYLSQQEYQYPEDVVLRAFIPYLERVDSSRMYWVTKRKKDAKQYAERYGVDVETLKHLDGKAVILTRDGEGGYLIVEDYRLLKPRRGSSLAGARRAAGFLFQRTDDWRIFLVLRSLEVPDAGMWDIPGGKIERGESDFEAALREAVEEVGPLPPGIEVKMTHTSKLTGFTYVTFHAFMDGDDAHNWTPRLNWEHDEWGWFEISNLPEPTHPGVIKALEEMR